MHFCPYPSIHAYIHLSIHTYMSTYIYQCMHTYICIHICMSTCMYTYMYRLMHVCLHTYICTHIHIYMYTEIHHYAWFFLQCLSNQLGSDGPLWLMSIAAVMLVLYAKNLYKGISVLFVYVSFVTLFVKPKAVQDWMILTNIQRNTVAKTVFMLMTTSM